MDCLNNEAHLPSGLHGRAILNLSREVCSEGHDLAGYKVILRHWLQLVLSGGLLNSAVKLKAVSVSRTTASWVASA